MAESGRQKDGVVLIRQKLSEKGLVIGSNDMLIAATSITYSAVLVTHNVREFSRIDGLVVEDWLK